MRGDNTRLRIENEIFGRMEKKYSEEEQANYLMSLLMDHYPLLSAVTIAMDPEGEELSVFAQRGLSGKFIKEMYTKKALPVIRKARENPVAVSGGDARAGDPSFRLEHGYKSLFAAPCRLQEETLGVFLVDSDDPGLLTPETQETFLAYARLATFFLALRSLRGRISRVPDMDSVTGLYSFKSFHEVLHREFSRGKKLQYPVSLLFLKVRNLREMNGVYGHVVADAGLAETARRIRERLRDVDYAARSGGMIYIVLPQMGKTERVLIPHTEAMVHESVRKGGNAVTVYRD